MLNDFLIFSIDVGDYDKSPVSITFPRCSTEKCIDVPIFYGCDMEPDESFKALLQPQDIASFIIIDDRQLTVNITDSDCKTLLHFIYLSVIFVTTTALGVRLEHTVYRVEENVSQVEVCATLQPLYYTPAIPFSVHIHTLPDSAGMHNYSRFCFIKCNNFIQDCKEQVQIIYH